MNTLIRMPALAATLVACAGCAVLPLDKAAEEVSDRVQERVSVDFEWPPDAAGSEAAPEIREPLSLPAALAMAFTRNPEIRRQYARLGIAHADLMDAARISNPTLSLAWLSPSTGGRDQTSQEISTSFTDLLLLPSRRRLSTAEFRRVELVVGSELVSLARKVESAWYTVVAARQVATMREAVAEATQSEAALAQRYFEAGNISRLQLDLQQAAAARADIDSLRARSDAATRRAQLADLLGLPTRAEWQTVDRLSIPPDTAMPHDELTQQALSRRLDLAALREEVAVLEDTLGVTERWRLLGTVEAGYKQEREVDGSKLRGPTLNLELPIFNQGQGAIARAEAQLLDARTRAESLALVIENEVTNAVEQLALARDVSESYRQVLLPSTASAVERQQERVNFMLVGVFELIRTKREQYDAWQGYFESVRDYWVARTALRVAAGGMLPGDDESLQLTVGADEIVMPDPATMEQNEMPHEHPKEPQ